MKKTEVLQVTGLSGCLENIDRIGAHNPDYDLSQKELADTGRIGERIFEHEYHPQDVAIKELPPDSSPENPEDAPVRLGVYADRELIGYVISKSVPHLQGLLQENRLLQISLHLQGGPYKILLPDTLENLETQRDHAGLSAYLTVEYEDLQKDPDALPNPDSSEGGYAYISITYETSVLEYEEKKRGNAFLSLSIIMAGGYLLFLGLYWWFVRSGKTTPLSWLGSDLTDQLMLLHLSIAAGGLLAAILGLLTKNSFWPVLGALLLTLACYPLPGYAVFLGVPALFCIFAALRRHSKKLLSFLKVLALLTILASLGFFLKHTAQNLWQSGRFALLPTNHSTAGAAGGRGSETLEGDDAWDAAEENWDDDEENWEDGDDAWDDGDDAWDDGDNS